jgi:hypothetical protein
MLVSDDFDLTRRFLANLWSRGAILQCARNQSSIESLCVVYFGSFLPGALFDLDKLGAFILKITNKFEAANPKERSFPPVGDLDRSLPCLTCVLELGNESCHPETHSKFKTTASGPTASHGRLRESMDRLFMTVDELDQYQKSTSPTQKRIEELQQDIQLKHLEVEEYDRYSIIVRGASPKTYGILNEAGIAKEFAALLAVTMPQPDPETSVLRHMQPFGRLDDSESSPHTAWMWE